MGSGFRLIFFVALLLYSSELVDQKSQWDKVWKSLVFDLQPLKAEFVTPCAA